MNNNQNSFSQEIQTSKSSKSNIIFLITLLVIILIVLGFYFLKVKKTISPTTEPSIQVSTSTVLNSPSETPTTSENLKDTLDEVEEFLNQTSTLEIEEEELDTQLNTF